MSPTAGIAFRILLLDRLDETGCKKHAAMGFEGGWGTALDQLVAMVKKGI